jgi:hypothetical protein
MAKFSVGDAVEMLVSGKPVDRGVVREITEDRETGITIAVIDWQKAGRIRQMVGDLRKQASR